MYKTQREIWMLMWWNSIWSLPDVIDCRSEIVGTVGECTMGPVFDAKSPIVGVMDTHARFVIFQVIATLRVTCRSMKIRAPAKKYTKWKNKNFDPRDFQCQSLRKLKSRAAAEMPKAFLIPSRPQLWFQSTLLCFARPGFAFFQRSHFHFCFDWLTLNLLLWTTTIHNSWYVFSSKASHVFTHWPNYTEKYFRNS